MNHNTPNIVGQTKAVVQMFPGHELLEKYGELFRVGLDKAFERKANIPIQGAQFFTSSTDTKGYKKYQSKVGIGLMRQRKDDEPLPKTEGANGFGYEFSSILYAVATSVAREVLEKDLYAQFGKDMKQLADSSQRTLELIYADVFNRGMGGIAYATAPVANGASQFICEDGLYLVAKDRPNPFGPAGSWSNRLDDVAWVAGGNNDALFAGLIRDFKLGFKQYRNDRGDKSPMTLKRLIVSPVLEDMAMRVTDTKMVYSGTGLTASIGVDNTTDPVTSVSVESKFSDNAVNTISGTPFTVYDWLDDGLVYAEANGENELETLWAQKPSTVVYSEGNPDMMNYRIRMEMGNGCARPSTWMGALTTNTAGL